jgi:ubiquinone/menaquinone biosynthesis C-methylase UbiE
MKNSIEINKNIWNDKHGWEKDGDEWNGQAIRCNVPYEYWKQSLFQTLILPNIRKNDTVLEIGAGHGRWSTFLVKTAKSIILLDLSPNCIDFCKKLFVNQSNIKYIVNDGKTLADVEDSKVDFIWSYDTFVHIEKSVIDSYMQEIFRVLKSGGRAIIHHPGRNHFLLWLGFMRHFGNMGNRFYRTISMYRTKDTDGWRSNISKQMVRNLASKNDLKMIDQLQYWDKKNKIGVPRFNDYITILEKK